MKVVHQVTDRDHNHIALFENEADIAPSLRLSHSAFSEVNVSQVHGGYNVSYGVHDGHGARTMQTFLVKPLNIWTAPDHL